MLFILKKKCIQSSVLDSLEKVTKRLTFFLFGPSYPPSRASFSSFTMWGTAFLVEWLSPGQNVDHIALQTVIDTGRPRFWTHNVLLLSCLIGKRKSV